MLHQMSHRARVDASLQDGLGDTALNNLAKILKPENDSANCKPMPLNPTQVATALKESSKLAEDHYKSIMPCFIIYRELDDHTKPFMHFLILQMPLFFLHMPSFHPRCIIMGVPSAVKSHMRVTVQYSSIILIPNKMIQGLFT